MPYIGTSPSNSVRRVHTYTATASQTTFTGASSEGVTLSYADTSYIDVFQNGVLLGNADYTSTSGTSVVLAQGASADDLIVIVVYDVFSVADTVSKTNGGTFDNGITIDADGATVLTVDRATSDGTIIDVQKSGSTVGSIGYESSGFHINGEANHSGLSFQAPNVTPRYNGSITDDFVHLGSTSNRFKDLYLSGGVYLGGTGSANKLSDVETGTWSATLSQGTCTTAHASYTKIGKRVHVSAQLNTFSNRSSTASVEIRNLPFARDTSKDEVAGGPAMWSYVDIANTVSYVATGGLQFYGSQSGGFASLRYADLNNSSSTVYFVATYFST